MNRRTLLILLPSLILLLILPLVKVTAQTDTTLELKGLREPVEILRDQWGMNHIYAQNQHDLFFAQGYAAAKDRLFQFEMWRRQATGTVAEILGPDEVERDIGARLFKFRGDLQKELNHYHPEGEEIITAYTDGVNAYIEEVLQAPEQLPFEFKMLNIKPHKWTPDVVISRHQGLLGNINEELRIGMAVAKAGEEQVKELMWFHPREPDLKMDPVIDGSLLSRDVLRVYNAFRTSVTIDKEDIEVPLYDAEKVAARLNEQLVHDYNSVFEHGLEGSNNWVIAPEKSASGSAMLANDPHRRISVPSLRYMVHLVAPGWNVVGGGEPTIPGVSIGHNEYGAWGLTVYGIDAEDLYVYQLNPENLEQYRYKGEWKAMESLQERILVEGRDPVDAQLRYTIHGPVTYIDSLNHTAYAVKGGWMEIGGAPYLASLRMDQARNWEEFRDACSYSHIPGENMIWAGRDGDIGWQVVGIGPLRENFSGMVPVPGDGRYEWSGYIPIKDRPHSHNPPSGYIVTANENVTPDDYPLMHTVGYTWADAFRGNRIREVLDQKRKFTMEDMASLQTDYYSVAARDLVPMLDWIEPADDTQQQAKELLKDWNYVLDKNSVEAGIYALWERQILKEARERFVPAKLKGLVNVQLTKVIHWMNHPQERFEFNPEQERNEFLNKTFSMAIAELQEKLGGSMEDWKYGQEHYKHVLVEHQFADFVDEEMQDKINVGPFPTGGNSYTPNVTGSSDNMLHGASFRMIMDVGNWDRTLMINSPGQSADPRSPYFDNLFEQWANNEFFNSYFSREKIEQETRERTVLVPAESQK